MINVYSSKWMHNTYIWIAIFVHCDNIPCCIYRSAEYFASRDPESEFGLKRKSSTLDDPPPISSCVHPLLEPHSTDLREFKNAGRKAPPRPNLKIRLTYRGTCRLWFRGIRMSMFKTSEYDPPPPNILNMRQGLRIMLLMNHRSLQKMNRARKSRALCRMIPKPAVRRLWKM